MFCLNVFLLLLPFRSDAGQRATAASSAEVAEDAVSQTNDLNPERLRTQHSRRRHDDADDVARGVRFRRRAGHSRERRWVKMAGHLGFLIRVILQRVKTLKGVKPGVK